MRRGSRPRARTHAHVWVQENRLRAQEKKPRSDAPSFQCPVPKDTDMKEQNKSKWEAGRRRLCKAKGTPKWRKGRRDRKTMQAEVVFRCPRAPAPHEERRQGAWQTPANENKN